MLKILFVAEHGESPSAVYRAHLPARYLRGVGYDARVCHYIAEAPEERLYGVSERGLFNPDVIFTRKIADVGNKEVSMAERFHTARRLGQHVFYDLDDDMWSVPDWNPAASGDTKEMRAIVEDNMRATDGIVAATPALAAMARRSLGDISAYVCRSGIDVKLFSGHTEHKPLRVGWMGETRYRGPSLAYHADAIFSVLDGYTESTVQFWQLGYMRGSPDVSDFLGKWAKSIEIIRRPWVPYSKLPAELRQIDIGIIPEKPSRFAQSRSATSGLAMGAASLPYLASSNPEYEYLEQEYDIGITVGEDWSLLGTMLETAHLRKQCSTLNRSGIETHFNYHETGKAWEELIKQCT